jgi:hypothetical protein
LSFKSLRYQFQSTIPDDLQDKPNMRRWIEHAAAGEVIEAIVVGEESSGNGAKPQIRKGALLSWAEAAPLLDYEFDDGFGGADCHPVIAWTANRIIQIHEYDGSTSISWIPRHPLAHLPDYA